MTAWPRIYRWLTTGWSVAPAAPAVASPAPPPRMVEAPPAPSPVPPQDHPGGSLGPMVDALRDMPEMWLGGVPPEVFALSEAFEAFRPSPYRDSGGVWTIGIGSTRDPAGLPVTPATPPVTRRQAEVMAERDLARAARLAAEAFPGGLPARWGAVAILTCNNMGDMRAWGPTLRRLLLAGEYRRAANQLAAYRNADGKPETGLRRRRWAEAAYALGMNPAEARRRAWATINTPDDWPPLP